MPTKIFLVLLLLCSPGFAHVDDSHPLWNYGIGLFYIKLEHYPGSKEFSYLMVPTPILEYRGRVSRLEQNDGARAYLLKDHDWGLDLSGGLQVGQKFSSDTAREGMPELPWVIELGPQIVRHLSDHWQLRFGFFQAFSTQFRSVALNGQFYDWRIVFKNEDKISWPVQALRGDYLAWSLQAASEEWMSTYYEVKPIYATATRPTYETKAGIVLHELAYYQTYTAGLTTLFVGAYLDNYDIAANHSSPQMQSDHNFTYFVGLAYTFSKSEKQSVDPKDTEGLINRIYEKKN